MVIRYQLKRVCSSAAVIGAREIHQQVVTRGVGDSREPYPAAQQKGVADDLGLLFDAVLLELPAGLEAVVVAAERVAVEQQVPVPQRLGLPDVGHLVDEEPLADRR